MTSQFKKRLRPLFAPDSVAIIGASNSPAKWGNRILFNLTRGNFKGRIYPVNPSEKEVLGLASLSSISDLPMGVDLAVITIPPKSVLRAISDCLSRNVKRTATFLSPAQSCAAYAALWSYASYRQKVS